MQMSLRGALTPRNVWGRGPCVVQGTFRGPDTGAGQWDVENAEDLNETTSGSTGQWIWRLEVTGKECCNESLKGGLLQQRGEQIQFFTAMI